LDRIIGDHARTLLEHLRSKAPGPDYAVAVAFAYPNHQFNPFYMYGTVAEKTPPTSRTIFAIGSITKTFTAALFANGVSMRPDCFDWDAGLKRYLSGYLGNTGDLSPTMQQITPRMLARHTSGLPDSTSPQDGVGLFLKNPSAAPPRLVDVWRTHNSPQPGSCWTYSNLGFVTLGFAAVSAYGSAGAGASYAGLLRDQITGPLNMPDTVTVVPDGAPLGRAHPNDGDVSSGSASDINFSAADMHTWLLAQLGAVNGPSTLMKGLATTTQPAPLSVGICGKPHRGPADMGLAWQVEPGPPQIIWKDGLTSLGGCSCWIGFTPPAHSQEPLGIAILVNGYWDKDDPPVLADNHGPSILRQISAAI
jgi:CubicO group peptidase (beta-lactamase class C family)